MAVVRSELTGIGSWRLAEAIGAGERATVYRGQDAGAIGAEARPMAVKVLHGVLAHDPHVVAAFVARAEAHVKVSRADHPAIVPARAVVTTQGRPFVVLDLADAVSLERLFPERGRPKFSLEAGTNILIGVLDALAAAANEKIVHGRLSPNDVLVHADGAIALTGFGQEGDGRMDFLAVHRLAQTLNAPWPPEIDAWLDVLVSERGAWKDARAARQAFPLAYAEDGRKALERGVRARRRKDQKALEEAAAAAEAPDEGDGDDAEAGDADATEGSSRGGREARRRARRERDTMSPDDTEAALRQARAVALAALGIVLIGLAVAVLG